MRERERERGMRFDGLLPCLATSASLWSVRDGKEISSLHLAESMGHDLSNMRYNNMPLSEPMLRNRLGLSMHVASCGAMMMLLLSTLG